MGSQFMSRRNFMRGAGLGAAALLGSSLDLFGRHPLLLNSAAASWMDEPAARSASARMPAKEPFVPDAEISLTAAEKQVQILPGAQDARLGL